MNREHRDYNFVEMDQNTEENSWVMRSLAVTQSPEEDPQLTLVWKTHQK